MADSRLVVEAPQIREQSNYSKSDEGGSATFASHGTGKGFAQGS